MNKGSRVFILHGASQIMRPVLLVTWSLKGPFLPTGSRKGSSPIANFHSHGTIKSSKKHSQADWGKWETLSWLSVTGRKMRWMWALGVQPSPSHQAFPNPRASTCLPWEVLPLNQSACTHCLQLLKDLCVRGKMASYHQGKYYLPLWTTVDKLVGYAEYQRLVVIRRSEKEELSLGWNHQNFMDKVLLLPNLHLFPQPNSWP